MVRGLAEASAPPQPVLFLGSCIGTSCPALPQQRLLRLHPMGRADPGSTDGDGPAATINLVSLNITSLQANWNTITALGKDYNAAIIAMQETRHAHPTRQAIATNAASPLHGGYKASFGPDIPCARIVRKAAHGGTDHTVIGTAGENGGVAIFAKDAVVDSTRDDPSTCVARLKATKRWHEVFQPICSQRQRRRRRNNHGPAGIYVASVYGRAGGDSTDIFRLADCAAARVGSAPYFICMDANTDIDANPHLLHMLNHGWYNVAEGTPDHLNHTYGGLLDWDRTTKCAHTSRIDYILANKAGRSLVKDFCYLRDLPAKSHVGLQATLDLGRLDQTASRLLAPTPYPPNDGGHEEHELQALGALIAGRYHAGMVQADSQDDVEKMFAIANEASHVYHQTRLRDLPPPKPRQTKTQITHHSRANSNL